MFENVEKDLSSIDLDDLHYEWIKQCDLMLKYSLILYGNDDKEGLETERSNYRSKFAKDLRINDAKISEAKINNQLEEDEEYIKLTQKVHLLKNIIDNLQNRKRALENLVQLWIAQYWATPKEPNDRENVQRKKLKKEM